MTSLVRLLFAALLVVTTTTAAMAQYPAGAYPGQGYPDPGYPDGGAVTGGGAYRAPLRWQMGAAQAWYGVNLLDRGVGYEGSYMSLGTMLPFWEDNGGGVWYFDGRYHLSENGGFFTNNGIGRRQFFRELPLTAGFAMFFDWDGDEYRHFGHDFSQIGLTGELLHPLWLLRINGYLPVGETNYNLGSATNGFVGHNFLVQYGLDTALRGMNFDFGFNLPGLEAWNGKMYLGSYYYESASVDGFAGFHAMIETFPLDKISMTAQVNHDDQFGTTALFGVALKLGGPQPFASNGALMTPVQRNDHIVRVHQDPIFASNPFNGQLYNVVHVDNSNTSGVEDGSFENPYNTLAEAQTNSVVNDVIYVRAGDGTSTGYDTGIQLKQRQYLFGDGGTNIIPTIEAGNFTMCNLSDFRPILTNQAGPAVRLSSDNTVSGIIVDGAQTGILGQNIVNTTIQYVDVTNSISNGISLVNARGTHFIANNNLINNGVGATAGLRIQNNSGDTYAVIQDNIVNSNGTGIQMVASGGATRQHSLIQDNLIIGNRGIGVSVTSNGGANVGTVIRNNNISRNGVITSAGIGIALGTTNGNLTAQITDNLILGNAGTNNIIVSTAQGISGDFAGNSNVQLDILRNDITGRGAFGITAGFGIGLEFRVSNTNLQRVNISENTISDTDSVGVRVVTENNTRLDLGMVRNIVTGSFDDGLWIISDDSSVLRLTMIENQVVMNTSLLSPNILFINGITLNSFGTSRLIATLNNNRIDRNGFLFPDGIHAEAADNSSLALIANNNQITGNGDDGIDLTVFDTATLAANLDNNNIGGNAFGDIEATVGILSTGLLCLEMSNNLSGTIFLTNLGAGTLQFADQGGNTGFPFILGTVTNVGSCAPVLNPIVGP